MDLQGFKQSGEIFVLKEFAVISVNERYHRHWEFIVKPPYPFENLLTKEKIINSWLTRNVHGIPWDCGTIPYDEAKIYVRRILIGARRIYVMGPDVKMWLLNVLGFSVPIIDLKRLKCPALVELKNSLNQKCPNHLDSREFRCAAENVKLMRTWMLDNDIVPQPRRKINFLLCLFKM